MDSGSRIGAAMGLSLGLLVSSCGGVALLELVSTGPRASETIEVGGQRIRFEVGERGGRLGPEAIEAWVLRAATMLAEYCDGFPVPHLRVRVLTGSFGGVGFGQHWEGRRVTVVAGNQVTERGLERDWVMVHELAHTAFPRLARRHLWMREGMSTYLETVLRARAGILTEEEVWRKWVRYMHNGLPRRGDRGLDRTHTWGRTYWGGALFWMLVDADLREETNNERSLQDVVRGVLRHGGNATEVWTTQRVAEVSDEVTETDVVSRRYAAMARRPGTVDLDAFYARLGVIIDGDEVRFDDRAPLAHVRRAMNARTGLQLQPLIE